MMMNVVLAIAVVAAIAVGCGGKTEEEKEQEKAAVLEEMHKLELFGRSIYLKKTLLELTCNEYMMSYFMNPKYNECVGVTVKSTLKFPSDSDITNSYNEFRVYNENKGIDYKWTEKDDVITIPGGQKYYCLLYSDNIDQVGNDSWVQPRGSTIFLSKVQYSKVSEIDPKQIDGHFPDKDFCELMQ